MGYVDLLRAVHEAPLVLTDSGGVQKRLFSLGTPCVVLRDKTEWVEQVEKVSQRWLQCRQIWPPWPQTC